MNESQDNSEDDVLLKRVRTRVATDSENIDAATTERLRVARLSALAELDTRRPWYTARLLPAGALAASAAVLAMLLLLRDDSPVDVVPAGDELVAAVDDFDILTGEDDIEMIEDLAFYRWLVADGDSG